MIKIKKGFTIIEILVCLAILVAVAGIFSINFIKNLNDTAEKNYTEIINNIEASADAYVMTYKDSSDIAFEEIQNVVISDEAFCYIPVAELQDKGLLEKEITNPKTGEEINGAVKFTNEEDGSYKFEYVEDEEPYVIIVYDKNGADSISKSAQGFACENIEDANSLAKCVGDATLPTITRKSGKVIGWSVNPSDTTSNYSASTSLANLIKNSNYYIEGKHITLYAISSDTKTAYFEKNDALRVEVTQKSCTIYNSDMACNLTLPSFTPQNFYEVVDWNTKEDGTGDSFKVNDNIVLTTDMTLYTNSKLLNFNVSIEKFSRVTEQTNIPLNANIIFVLDKSGSMSGSRIANLKTVCNGLVDKINLNNSTVSVISFGSSSNLVLSYSQSKTDIKSAINSLSASGGTNYNAALGTTNTLLAKSTNGKPNYVIFVSDGVPTSNYTSSQLSTLHSYATEVYSMGISVSSNSYLMSIATGTNNYYYYNDSSDDSKLTKFYEIFYDIISNIVKEVSLGTSTLTVTGGYLNALDNLNITADTPFKICVSSSCQTFTVKDGTYFEENAFNVIKYLQNKGYTSTNNITINYFVK